MSAEFSPAVRVLVQQKRAGYHCERCGGEAYYGQLHHRRPRGSGSTRRKETAQAANALLLCTAWDKNPSGGCHEWVESQRTKAFEHGWLVRQRRDPAEVPVYRRRVWVLLDDEGFVTPIPEPAGGKVA